MGRTLSPRELQNGREEYAIEYNSVLLAKIAEGKRLPQTNNTINVRETLIELFLFYDYILAYIFLFVNSF